MSLIRRLFSAVAGAKPAADRPDGGADTTSDARRPGAGPAASARSDLKNSGSARAGTDGARPAKTDPSADRGFLLFEQTGDVIAAERLLRESGYAVEVKGPPPQLRRGCDMVLVCPLMLHAKITAQLERAGLHPMEYVPVSDPLLEPVSFFHVTDLGEWLMVRAANMKITVEKAGGTIVNISGGGCPDVPYLASLLMGRKVGEAEEPRLHGRTLCSYALQRAFEEARRLCG
ncbi:MAG: DUF3343 domain-containing protein [Desulfovibrionaceae bacterium]|nr:DUF3343 domain-containing protein [Desulfovibrionaceae bacterium]